MRQLLFLFTLITSYTLSAQELPKFVKDKFDFCDSNFTEDQSTQMRLELNELEKYFLVNGLLTDKSGKSYRAVYEQITRENDLIFEIDTTFELLEELEMKVYISCFYKVLTPEQLAQLTERHQIAAERITRGFEGNVTPSLAAQRILENLTEDDFELEFYRVSALLSFYRTSTPSLTVISQNDDSSIERIQVVLNENSQIMINSTEITAKNAELIIYKFLSTDPELKGIDFMASRSASYESYLQTIEIFNSIYLRLRSIKGDIPKNIIYRDPK